MSEKTAEYQTTNEAIRLLTSTGLHLLKESILEVLYIARLNDDEWVKAAVVRRRVGMAKSSDPSDMGNASVRHMLLLLSDDGKTEQSIKGGPWRITDAEFKKRNKAST